MIVYKPQIYFFVSCMIFYKTKIQQEVYSKSWCFAHSMLYAFLPAFLRFVQNVWKANARIFFLVYSACMNFSSLNFPLHEFFVSSSPAPHPPPPITFLMVHPKEQSLTWMPETFYGWFPASVISLEWAVCPHLFSALSKFKCLAPNVWTHFEPIFSLRVHGWIQTTVSQLAGVRGCRRKRQLSF